MASYPVKVFVYDISKGLARSLSMGFLGKQIDGVWHTGVVVYGEEYYFGGGGIESCPPMGTILGQPDTIHDLGMTQIPKDVFLEYLRELSMSTFKPSCYHLLEHNCNTFSSELAQFLTGHDIPSHITSLPAEVLSTPFGQMLKPFVDAMSVSPDGGRPLFSEGVRPSPAHGHGLPQGQSTTSPHQQSAPAAAKPTESKTKITKKEAVKFSCTVNELLSTCRTSRSELLSDLPVESPVLSEVLDYLTTSQVNWSLSPQHIQTLGAVILNSDRRETTRLAAASLLQLSTLKRDVIMAIKHDQKHTLSQILADVGNLPNELFITVSKVVVNCAATEEGHRLLTSQAPVKVGGASSTNLRLTVSVCVTCLLNDRPNCWNMGAAAVTNLLIHGVDEDTSVELSGALLQCLTMELSHSTANLLLWSIVQLMTNIPEVRALARVMEVDWGRFLSISAQCRDLSQEAQRLLST